GLTGTSVSPLPLTLFLFYYSAHPLALHSFPTRRSSDLSGREPCGSCRGRVPRGRGRARRSTADQTRSRQASRNPAWELSETVGRSEEHTSELQSLRHLVCRLLLEKKNNYNSTNHDKQKH